MYELILLIFVFFKKEIFLKIILRKYQFVDLKIKDWCSWLNIIQCSKIIYNYIILYPCFYAFLAPEYKSKLFLDCCGLVRRVMRDLAEDFGFIIGPWNQAYMFDTLPMVVESEKDMKPGDLVFISATYYNPKCKNITVECFFHKSSTTKMLLFSFLSHFQSYSAPILK